MNASHHSLVRTRGRGRPQLILLAMCTSSVLLTITSPGVVTAGPRQAPAAPDYPRYRLIDLGTLGAHSPPSGISENGLITGFSANGTVDPPTGFDQLRAVLWDSDLTGRPLDTAIIAVLMLTPGTR